VGSSFRIVGNLWDKKVGLKRSSEAKKWSIKFDVVEFYVNKKCQYPRKKVVNNRQYLYYLNEIK
jgi:hypothetical protein